jgi:5-methyltetrahydropteroyltriglutamate--homocysteine methyltransferase
LGSLFAPCDATLLVNPFRADPGSQRIDEPLQAVLPGPYSLADLATDDYYGDPAEFLAAVSDFLAAEVAAFPDHETLFLLEPSLVESPPGDGLDERVPEAISAVAAETDADVVVHTYWGALEEKTYAHLMDSEVAALGFDVVAGDREQTLYNVTEFGTTNDVALGLVDGQNTRVESAETIRERVDWFTEQVPSQEFETAYLTPNTELFYLPVSKAREKLDVLAAAAATEEEVEA